MVMIAPTYTIFTTVTNVPAENGILVTTRLPLNMFVYAASKTVRVEGSLHMKLVEPTRRRLLSISPESWSQLDDDEGFDETPSLSMDMGEDGGLDETPPFLPVDEEEPFRADEKPSSSYDTAKYEVTVELQLEPEDISYGVTRSGRIAFFTLAALCITLL